MSQLASWSLLLLSLQAPSLSAAEHDQFSGHYGHHASDPVYQPVWQIEREGDGWQASTLADGEHSPAQELPAEGRRAFWEKMGWPPGTSAAADCITWGEAPPSLLDALDSLEAGAAPAPAAAYGNALLCHVSADTRANIDWLAGNADDWFYYDPIVGVMEVRRVP